MQIHHAWGKQGRSFQVVEGLTPGESDDEGGQRNPRVPHTNTGLALQTVLVRGQGLALRVLWVRTQPADSELKTNQASRRAQGMAAVCHTSRGQLGWRDQCLNKERLVSLQSPTPICPSLFIAHQDTGASGLGARVITMAAIDVHLPNSTNSIQSNPKLAIERVGSTVSNASTSISQSSGSLTVHPHSLSSHTPGSSMADCSSSTAQDVSLSSHCCCPPSFSGQDPCRDPSAVVQELLSSLSEDSCLAQKGLAVDPVNLKLPSPTGSENGSPELDKRINLFNCKNQEDRRGRGRGCVLMQTKPLIHLQGSTTEPSLEEKYRLLGPADSPLGHMPDT
ncbi:hypothetical protein GOODEAATRI_010882 [Goodea atripinnis]|uniref:Uncharacterized protein n=1 Tax=Goodea atripinnis TaxID=208336 RepID=A0ABV0PD20_9TELE